MSLSNPTIPTWYSVLGLRPFALTVIVPELSFETSSQWPIIIRRTGSLALESNIVELRLRVHMITEALDSFLGLNGYIGRHRSDIAHRDIDTIWGSAGFFGLEDERLRCILGHLPFAVDFTGYDDKLHIGVNILAKAAGIEESGIENIGVVFSGFLAKSAYIGGRSTACKVDYIVIVRLGKWQTCACIWPRLRAS